MVASCLLLLNILPLEVNTIGTPYTRHDTRLKRRAFGVYTPYTPFSNSVYILELYS